MSWIPTWFSKLLCWDYPSWERFSLVFKNCCTHWFSMDHCSLSSRLKPVNMAQFYSKFQWQGHVCAIWLAFTTHPPPVNGESWLIGLCCHFPTSFIALQWPPTTWCTNLVLLVFHPLSFGAKVWQIIILLIVNNLKLHHPDTVALVRMFTLEWLKFDIWFPAQHNLGSANPQPGQIRWISLVFPSMLPALMSSQEWLQPWNCLPR